MNATDVLDLRIEAETLGTDTTNIPDHALEALIRRAHNDIDLAAVALNIDPRPAWVAAIVGT